jgi:hypothetical protein
MSRFTDYFDQIFVINLATREDRLAHFISEMLKIGVTRDQFSVFNGYLKPKDHNGIPSGNLGCTASHRALLEIIAWNKWRRVLIFEDDAELIGKPEDFDRTWDALERNLPNEWDMLYLGGHYGEDVQGRVNRFVLRTGTMLTTSSYGVTWWMARKMAPYISGIGPIDSLYGGFHRENECFCIQPRLFAQYPNYSDLQDREMNNRLCMTDRRHESMLPGGYVGAFKDYVRPNPTVSAGKVMNPSQHIR